MLNHLETYDAVQSWGGHARKAQDFQLQGGLAIEVKTTSENVPSVFNISNTQQLDDSSFKQLFIALVQVNENRAAGLSLNKLVDELIGQLDTRSLDKFKAGLLRVGYLDEHRDQYKELYDLKAISFYQVKEGFPRLTTQNIPEGIKDVKYKISTDACKSFRVSQETITDALVRTVEDDQ